MTSSAFEFLKDNIAVTPFHQWLMPQLVEVDEQQKTVTIQLEIRPEMCRVAGRPDLHGGIISALIDITGHAAVAVQVRHNVATIDMRVDYLRLAGGTAIRAVGSIIKLGRTIAVVDVRLFDDQDKLVAVGRASYVTANM